MTPAPAHTAPLEIARDGARQRREKLYLALHFHALPLHAASLAESAPAPAGDTSPPDAAPMAVFENHGSVQRIVASDTKARQAGVNPMMKPGEAKVACPHLRLLPRNTHQEHILLGKLADMLEEFSSEVSIRGDLTLVMEVARSLRLFGGMDPLIAVLDQRLLGVPEHDHAVAPTPMAATLCARAGLLVRIEDSRRIRSVLGDLPVACLDVDARTRGMLSAMGLRVMRDLFRLPRAGLSRRFGSRLVQQLDALLGEGPDLLLPHRFSRHFDASLHLDEETTDLAVVIQAARVLLDDLEQQLRHGDSAIEHLTWTINPTQPAGRMVFVMPLGTPAWRADILAELFHLRLQSVTLEEPVRALSLNSKSFIRAPRRQHAIPGLVHATGSDHEFIDRLRSRLGNDAVHGIRPLAEHRPEYAWSTCAPGTTTPADTPDLVRPLWLLSMPAPLSAIDDHPGLGGRLRLQADTERIRCGWWDGRFMFRDYRQALTRRGQRLWIFRDARADAWYLHGIY